MTGCFLFWIVLLSLVIVYLLPFIKIISFSLNISARFFFDYAIRVLLIWCIKFCTTACSKFYINTVFTPPDIYNAIYFWFQNRAFNTLFSDATLIFSFLYIKFFFMSVYIYCASIKICSLQFIEDFLLLLTLISVNLCSKFCCFWFEFFSHEIC